MVAATPRSGLRSGSLGFFGGAVLAEAEFDAGNYVEAEAAAGRALSADPVNVRALTYKGRAQMELAKSSQSTPDWKSIRSWFTKANKLDNDNAEPLMLFYQTYVKQGVAPTKNAIDGLLYATALAPRDDELRRMAVRQLLLEERTQDAKRYFAPLAYQPHLTDEWKELNGQIMDAIAGGDRHGALGLIEKAEQLAEEEKAKKS